MSLTSAYRRSAEGALASYSYTDIAEGTGVRTIYGFTSTTNSTATQNYTLGSNTVYSNIIQSDFNVTTAPTLIGADFDLGVFNLPQTVDGTAYISVPWSVTNSAGDNDNYVQCTIRKWDGTTETDLVATSGAIISSSSGTVRNTLLKATVPRTHFKIGEQLRLSVEFAKTTAGNNPVAHLGHDPQNRDGANITPSSAPTTTTKLLFYCPFRLDL